MEKERKLLLRRVSFIRVGGGRGEHGLAIILDQQMASRVVNIEQEHGDRLLKLKYF